jgi:hypothetical protein
MRCTVIVLICSIGASGSAVAQSITLEQQQAVQDLAHLVAASEECDFAADEQVIDAYARRQGLDLETIGADPSLADPIEAALDEAREAAQQDQPTFCQRAWEMFGKDGQRIPGALRQSV